ncbi:MAG: hypothetical protein ACE5EK_09880 [Nitrospinales bacterium]
MNKEPLSGEVSPEENQSNEIQPPNVPEEKEVDLNLLFPETETDLNQLFPDKEMKHLLKDISKSKKDLGKMMHKIAETTDAEETPETEAE